MMVTAEEMGWTPPRKPASSYTPEERRRSVAAAVQLAILALRYCTEDEVRPAFMEWVLTHIDRLAEDASPGDAADARDWMGWFDRLDDRHLRGAAADIVSAIERGDIPG